MKTYTTSGTGGGQTLSEIETDKIPIYETEADVDADLANLAVGQIIGIKDTGDELSQPVDVVEEGNLHAVSSNAVAKKIPKFITTEVTIPFWSNYSYKLYPSDIGLTTFKDVFLSINAVSWTQMADLQSVSDTEAIIRVWVITSTTNTTVSLDTSNNLQLKVFAIRFS